VLDCDQVHKVTGNARYRHDSHRVHQWGWPRRSASKLKDVWQSFSVSAPWAWNRQTKTKITVWKLR